MSRCACNRPRRLGRGGVVALEMALATGCLVVMLLASMDLGRYFFSAQSLSYLVGEVARAATVNATAGCSNPVSTYAARAPMLNPAQLTLQLCIYPPNSTGNATSLTRVDVTASYAFSFVAPLLRGRLSRIDESVSMRFVVS
jgi:Flp pilus assembly protein TadG